MCRTGKMVNCNKLTHLQMNLHTISVIVAVAAMQERVFDFDVYLRKREAREGRKKASAQSGERLFFLAMALHTAHRWILCPE